MGNILFLLPSFIFAIFYLFKLINDNKLLDNEILVKKQILASLKQKKEEQKAKLIIDKDNAKASEPFLEKDNVIKRMPYLIGFSSEYRVAENAENYNWPLSRTIIEDNISWISQVRLPQLTQKDIVSIGVMDYTITQHDIGTRKEVKLPQKDIEVSSGREYIKTQNRKIDEDLIKMIQLSINNNQAIMITQNSYSLNRLNAIKKRKNKKLH